MRIWIFFLGCVLAAPAFAKPFLVVASIAQIAEPLAQIGAPCLKVKSMLGPGSDPHLYRLTRSDIVTLAKADAVLHNGLHLEANMRDVLDRLEKVKPVFALGESVDSRLLIALEGEDGKNFDPHVWMDVRLWRLALANAVQWLRAQSGCALTNADAYLDRLDQLDAYVLEVFLALPPKGRLLVTAHDAFSYLGRRYGLEVMGIQGLSTDREAGLNHLQALVNMLVERNVHVVFVESSVNPRGPRALVEGARARGHTVEIGDVLYTDAMGAPGSDESLYIGMMVHNVTAIAEALGDHAPLSFPKPW